MSFLTRFVRHTHASHLFILKRLIALMLMVAVAGMSVPPVAARSLAQSAAGRTSELASLFPQFLASFTSLLGLGTQSMMPEERQPRPQKYPVQPPHTRAEREARVQRLEISGARQVTLQAGQRTTFAALPLDEQGDAIQGLPVRWEASDNRVIHIDADGQAVAGNPGSTLLRVQAGNKQEVVQVTVVPAASSETSGSERNRLDQLARQYAHGTSIPTARLQQDPPLPSGDVSSLYEPRNAVGSPTNRYFPSAPTPPVASPRGREMPGSDNYSFSVPITELPGRGLNVSLALAYNSSIWHKSGTSNNRLTFDVDKGWPAPGFRLGYGHLQQQSTGGYTLVDSDGTRHEMLQTSPYNYISTDGTFLRMSGNFPTITYGDGTQVYYGAFYYNGTLLTFWPTKITDRHGNYLTINYQDNGGGNGNQVGPRISSIIDTLGRNITFHYDSNNNLVTITAPGYAETAARQEVRFYYETITDFTNKAKFQSSVTVNNRPSSIQVIKYLYFPGTQQGYRYYYSPYGMIRQIAQLRGMQVDSALTNQTGQVTSEGQLAATTIYNYPDTTPAAGLAAAPTYAQRTDDWAGRTSIIPVTTFETGTSVKITAPDGTISETISDATGDTTETKRTTLLGTTVYARTKLEWETDGNAQNRRIRRIQTTSDAYLTAAKTKTVAYSYTADYNNLDEIIEHDFNTAPDTPGPVLRRTKMTYVTDPSFPNHQAYIDRGLLHLPTSVQVFAGTSNIPSSRVVYAYDGATLVGYPHTGPNYILNYNESYDPYAPTVEECSWQPINPECPDRPCHVPGTGPCCQDQWVCSQMPVYNPATAKRGNLTSITAYADAAGPSGATTETITYDITGNIITETANCCQQRTYTYTWNYQFAYPETVTRGTGATQMTNSAAYDYDTGVPRSTTDENNQTTTLHYYPESLRPYETVRPDGGVTDIIYFADQLFADPDASRMHSAIMTVTSLDAGRTVRSWRFMDGRGAVARNFGESAGEGHNGAGDIEYDEMGRVWRTSNPYYAPYGAATPVNPTGLWTTNQYDPLGRPKIVTLQDGNTLQTDYAGETTTVTDQSGKQRRLTIDALGRNIQVDEPDAVSGALTQSTTYLYDSLNNLIKITQGAEQQRYFKYDSLSRLTHERQVEQDAPHVQADALTGNSYWSRKIVYNSDNLVTDSWDARNIQTHVSYDGLNRVSQITYAGVTNPTTPTVTYTYDEQRAGYFNRGALTTVTTAAVTGTTADAPQTVEAFDYDLMGRVQSHRQTIGSTTYTLGYSYNLAGLLQSETYPSGRVVTNSYDAAARLSGVADAGQTYANAFAYAGHGGLTSEAWGNGAIHTMAYNNRLQISQIKLNVAGVERQRYDYQYGEVNVDTAALDTTKNTGQVAVVDGWIDGTKQWQQRYAYDKLGRLSTGKELNNDATGSLSWRVDYTYDRWGNRYQAAGQGGVPVANTEIDKTRNRFVTVGSTLMIYDAAGNLTIDQKFRGLQHAYDANGRMRRSDATTGYATSVYDASGRRVQSFDSATNVTRQTVFDAFGRTVADYENGVWKRDYIYRGGGLLATVESSTTRYTLTDHQGSTRVITNQTGQVTSRHDYKPFGEELGLGVKRTTTQGYSVPSPLRQQYALTQRDASTGLDHTWFRKYDSIAGRWTSPDPYRGSMVISDPQSLNLYAYAYNDGVNLVDPTGLACYGYFVTYVTVLRDSKGKIVQILSVRDGGFVPLYCDSARPRTVTHREVKQNLHTVDRKVLSDCLNDLFGVKLQSYKEPIPGSSNGHAQVDDGSPFGISVGLNATTYTSQQIYELTQAMIGLGDGAIIGGLGTYFIGKDIDATALPFNVVFSIGAAVTGSEKGGRDLFDCVVNKGGLKMTK